MASIVENIVGDRALSLAGEEFVRKLSFGNNWNYIRIGILWRINGTGDLSSVRLQLGVNNGDINTLASSNCAGYLGVILGYPFVGGPVYTYEGVNSRYLHSLYAFGSVTKLGATLTTSVIAVSNVNQYMAASTSSGPRMNFAEIIRTSATTYTVYWFYSTSAEFNFGVPSTSDFLKSMESEAGDGWMTNFVSKTVSSSITFSVPILDTLSVYWNQLLPVEISALAVTRFM